MTPARTLSPVARGVLVLMALVSASPAVAEESAGVCERAIVKAEGAYPALPPGLLRAIGEVEALHKGALIWPWTANVDGESRFFNTRAELRGLVEAALDTGRQTGRVPSIDVGCLQVNLRWHGEMAHPRRLVDPEHNALYAARHLVGLFARWGSWSAAVRAYHAGHPAKPHGLSYACRVVAAWARLRGQPAAADAACEGPVAAAVVGSDGGVRWASTAKSR